MAYVNCQPMADNSDEMIYRAFVDFVIRDYNKPLGVATYTTSKDMSEKMRKTFLDVGE